MITKNSAKGRGLHKPDAWCKVEYSKLHKIVFLKSWLFAADTIYYLNDKKYAFYPHSQEDSNTLKYILFGYSMNKLWIFEVSVIASSKTWAGSTKLWFNMIYGSLYIYGLL
jgi:hypothetical protein